MTNFLAVGSDMPLLLIYLLFRFIVQYEGMSRRTRFYIVWLVDVDWMHLEVGLKWACWLCAES